jgi:hypothetical protein
MSQDEILNDAQRRDLGAYAGIAAADTLADAELLSRAAERIGMTGELAVDPDGVVELMRDDLLVVLESVADEDRDLVDHPELLHLAVLLRPRSDEERAALEAADLLDPREPSQPDAGEWTYAWWGSMATKLPRDTPLSAQMETLNRVLTEAEHVVERRELTGFFDRMAWLQHEDDADDDAFDDDELDDEDWEPEDDE